MVNFAAIFIPLLLLTLTFRLLILPIRWGWKLFLNSGCGFVCLWLLNTVAPLTGIAFPMNAVTVLIAGTLGLPGIGLLAILAVL